MPTFPKRTKKTPKNMRFVGMEIECLTKKEWDRIDYGEDEFWDEPAAYDKKCLGKAKKFVLDIHDDGSIEGEDNPAEVVTQPLLENRGRAMRALCNTIKARGGYTNASCGGHIHVDAKDVKALMKDDKNIVLAVKFLTLCEPALFATTGRKRLSNTFCTPLTVVSEEHAIPDLPKLWDTSRLYNDRYWSINLSALDEHGTIEFRLFAGTLEHEKWLARAAFAEAIVNKLHKVLKKPSLLNKLHKQSVLADTDLEEMIDCDFDKKEVYDKLIKKNGPELLEQIGKMVGLHASHRKTLAKQHTEIWSKYSESVKEDF